MGIGGVGVAAADVVGGGWGRKVLLGLSLILLGRAHCLTTWKRHGARWLRWTVWVSTLVVAALWGLRL